MNRDGIDCHKVFKVNELQNGKSRAGWTDLWEIPIQTLGIQGVLMLENLVTMTGSRSFHRFMTHQAAWTWIQSLIKTYGHEFMNSILNKWIWNWSTNKRYNWNFSMSMKYIIFYTNLLFAQCHHNEILKYQSSCF